MFGRQTPFVARARNAFAALAAVAVLVLATAGDVRADARVLDRLDVTGTGQGTRLSLVFTLPIRYVGHTPQRRGRYLQIQVAPLTPGLAGDLPADFVARYDLPVDPALGLPLVRVLYDGDGPNGVHVDLKFERDLRYSVSVSPDHLTLHVLLPEVRKVPAAAPAGPGEARKTAPAREGEHRVSVPLPPVPKEKLDRLMEDAATAMTAKDYARAVRLYTKLLRYRTHVHSRQALEFLGLARERKGQLAHAKAEYEKYLRLYPEGDGTERVRQRLAAILTAREAPKGPLKTVEKAPAGALDWDLYGSLSQFYRRDVSFIDNAGRLDNQSQLDSTLDATGRLRTESHAFESRISIGHAKSFLAGDTDSARISTLYVDALDKRRDASLRAGRQTRSKGGVLGRFDGVLAGYRVHPDIKVNAVAGFPVPSSSTLGVEDEKVFAGLSADFESVAEGWDVTVFAINQVADGMTDRRAVGGEVRYAGNDTTAFALVDYDVLFMDLNIAMVVANHVFPDRTSVNLSASRRKSPILTVSNALQGQTARSLASLNGSFSESEIQDLAADRTAVSHTVTVGASRPLDERFQVNGDVTVSHFSSTPGSGGVAATPNTGLEFFYSAQLIGSNLLTEGDSTILGLRYSDANTSDTLTGTLNSRVPLGADWRLNPRLRLDYRRRTDGGRQVSVKPALRVQYALRRNLRLELDAGGEWTSDRQVGAAQRTRGYFFNIGYRWDF